MAIAPIVVIRPRDTLKLAGPVCRGKDTQLGAEIEAKSSGLSEITEKGRMKREAKAAQEAAMESLYTQVCVTVRG